MNHTPIQPRGWNFNHKRWPLIAFTLERMARESSAARIEYELALARHFELKADSDRVQNILRRYLPGSGLVEAETFTYVGRHRFSAVRLTEDGKEYCQELGWDPCENEWESMLLHHSGDSQPKHTGAVLAFAMTARLRGWQVQVLPQTTHAYFFPDLVIQKGDEKPLYVEVELGTRKREKWLNYRKYCGFVSICSKTEYSRATLVRECKALGLAGQATDLQYLARTRAADSPLWLQSWDEKGESTE